MKIIILGILVCLPFFKSFGQTYLPKAKYIEVKDPVINYTPSKTDVPSFNFPTRNYKPTPQIKLIEQNVSSIKAYEISNEKIAVLKILYKKYSDGTLIINILARKLDGEEVYTKVQDGEIRTIASIITEGKVSEDTLDFFIEISDIFKYVGVAINGKNKEMYLMN